MVVKIRTLKAATYRVLTTVSNTPDDAGTVDESPEDEEDAAGQDQRLVPPRVKVHRLLRTYNGMTWQGRIKADTGWSASKTSRILGEMEQGDEIRRYRIGRENAVCLAGQEPESVRTRVDERADVAA